MIQAAVLLAFAATPQIQGLVDIPAGQTLLGADLKEMTELIEEKPSLAGVLGAEVPRSTIDVAAFRIGTTEVTNEMYLRFVQATGYQPPMTWLVLEAAELQELIRVEQKKDPRWTFNGLAKAKWWDLHWQEEGRQWRMPPEEALMPVTAISQTDARAYCRWAGLRLPTEEEWVRAARGDDEREFPYGAEFDPARTSHNNTKPANLRFKLLPVNAMPANASPFGCVDMSGNVWEWTDSRYKALPGFKTFQVKAKDKKKYPVLPAFDGSSPVVRGGGFMDPDIGTRIDRRQGVMTVTRAEIVGFRVASSMQPCANLVTYSRLDTDVRVLNALPEDAIDPEDCIGLERRRLADLGPVGAARSPVTLKGLEETAPPENYAVFDGYEAIAVAPLRALDFASLGKLEQQAEDNPVPVGILTTTVALATPNVTAGTYVLAYLPPLEDKTIIALGASLPAELMEKAPKGAKKDEERVGADFAGLQLLPKTEYLALVDENNVIVAAVPLKKKPLMGTFSKAKHEVTVNLVSGALDFEFRVADPNGRKAFNFSLPLVPLKAEEMVAKGYWDGTSYSVKVPE
ncbi:MAG: SUMF1/EgtB/PvdO family nonheme iron enzyme [Planctomycetes bacterium]|nr:SUMF1/EgtB/PvdO family nonheme iron enzyme [Planctomycetota bacterium]